MFATPKKKKREHIDNVRRHLANANNFFISAYFNDDKKTLNGINGALCSADTSTRTYTSSTKGARARACI